MTGPEKPSQQPPTTHAPLSSFAQLCDQLATTTKKLEKRTLIATYLATLTPDDAARAALYLAGTPFAETDPRKLQVGGSTLAKAVAQLSGADAAAMHAAYRRHGDLGEAAFDLLHPPAAKLSAALTLAGVEAALTALALARGPAAKLPLLLALLTRATPLEAKYLIKLASGDMRTGVKQSLVEEAIAVCYAGYAAQPAEVRRAVMLNGSLAEVVHMAASGTLAEARMRLFHPLGFMLASPVDSVDEALARFTQEVALEAATETIHATGLETAAEAGLMAATEAEQASSGPDDLTPAQAGSTPPTDQATPAIATSAPASLAPAATPLRAAQLEDKYDGMRAQLHCGDPTQPSRVGLFSRNREDLSESFPELIEAFAHFGDEVILDGEILAWQPAPPPTNCNPERRPGFPPNGLLSGGLESEGSAAVFSTSPVIPPLTANHPERSTSESSAVALALTPSSSSPTPCHPERSAHECSAVAPTTTQGRALPFSTLQQRLGRKRVTPEMRQSTPVIFMAFDLLYQQGNLLLEHPLADRRARLEALIATHAEQTDGRHHAPAQIAQALLFAEPPPSTPAFPRLLLAPAVELADAAQLDAAYLDARTRGNEGVMLKARMSLYQPGRRGLAWLKLKRELATLDVVITAAEFGHGRRAGVLSDYTFAVRNPTSGSGDALTEFELLNVGKAYSGLTDPEVEALSQQLHRLTLEDHGSYRTVEPVIILEVAFNNVMRSTRHPSGFALRFPRILRIRTDKPLAEIDTLARVEEIYASQPDRPVDA